MIEELNRLCCSESDIDEFTLLFEQALNEATDSQDQAMLEQCRGLMFRQAEFLARLQARQQFAACYAGQNN